MKRAFFLIAMAAMLFPGLVTIASADVQPADLEGTWSGGWTPDGGIRDAMTIELKHEGAELKGRFLTPVSLDFTKARFNKKTQTLEIDALDAGTGKTYKLNAKVEGTEIKGKLSVGPQSGEVQLIKWTYVPRFGR
jgi:hypothetical protein